MKFIVCDNYEEVSAEGAKIFAEQIEGKTRLCFGSCHRLYPGGYDIKI